MGREHAVVAMAVGPGRGDQPREPLEQLAGCEPEGGAAVGERACEPVDEARVGLAQGGLSGGGVEPVQREGGPGTVPDQALETGAVMGRDTDRPVEAETSGSAPGAHDRNAEWRAPSPLDPSVLRNWPGMRQMLLAVGSGHYF